MVTTILGINEVPSQSTVIGGFFIFISIFYYSLIIRTNRRFIGIKFKKFVMERPDFFSIKEWRKKSKLTIYKQRI